MMDSKPTQLILFIHFMWSHFLLQVRPVLKNLNFDVNTYETIEWIKQLNRSFFGPQQKAAERHYRSKNKNKKYCETRTVGEQW